MPLSAKATPPDLPRTARRPSGRLPGVAALICAATYLAGFALLILVLLPGGYDPSGSGGAADLAFAGAHRTLLKGWFLVIYLANGFALALLAEGLGRCLAPASSMAGLVRGLGLIWAGLVLAAGLVALAGLEKATALAARAPDQALALWRAARLVEEGLGGGTEIAGAAWLAITALALRDAPTRPRLLASAGLALAAAGVATLIPALGEAPGAVFGLGMIAWFAGIGLTLWRGRI
ncbi:hypothetical protein [Pseudooceanicola sp. 200-1SW]|uniref:hypothetical protein n=1 Tax=Pseudooceanicola sp. 200-1SW TaxID=3425949 RepID=UPI003D7F3BF1